MAIFRLVVTLEALDGPYEKSEVLDLRGPAMPTDEQFRQTTKVAFDAAAQATSGLLGYFLMAEMETSKPH